LYHTLQRTGPHDIYGSKQPGRSMLAQAAVADNLAEIIDPDNPSDDENNPLTEPIYNGR
jgi:hypothetical protein